MALNRTETANSGSDVASLFPSERGPRPPIFSPWLAPILCLLCLFLAPTRAQPPAPNPIRVAAAADLMYALEAIIQRFNQEHPESPATVSFGSSGNFFSQIQNGAPFDLFLSADIEYPKKLAGAGMAASPVFIYGIGRLAIWIPNVRGKTAEVPPGFKSLLKPSIGKIAIANPEHAPYGKAAVAALKSNQIYEQIAPKLVMGENIVQAALFAQNGAADAGIIALSLALSPAMSQAGTYWEIPPEAYPKLEQGGVVLKAGKNAPAAEKLRACLVEGWGREILKKAGFILPEK